MKLLTTKRSGALLLFLCLLLASCDEGLQPTAEVVPAGSFSGLITYHNWPPLDSLRNLRIVAFKVYPVTSILAAVLGNEAAVYPAVTDTALIPYYVDSLRYVFPLTAAPYQLVVVAQQYGPDLYKDWRVVGAYDTTANPATPTPIVVPANANLPGIDITVDFAHPILPVSP